LFRHPRPDIRLHSFRLSWREHAQSPRNVLQFLETPGTLHDATGRMAPRAQKQVTEFVSHNMAENHSLRHAASVGKLLGLVRENIGILTKLPSSG